MTIKTPSTFIVQGVPPGIFGEAYVIISVWQEGSTWKAEYNTLTTRPNEHLTNDVVEFNAHGFPSELDPIDEAYMEAEALREVERKLLLELEQRAVAAGRPDIAYLPITLKRASITPVTLWVRQVFPNKFLDMASTTKSPEMKKYLRIVMGLQKLRG